MRTLSRNVTGLMTLAFVFVLGAGEVSAQEPFDAIPQCVVEVSPALVPAGEAAVPLNLALSDQVGEVRGIDAPGSGVVLASPGDLPLTEMSAEERPQPIALGEGNTWTVWVNTSQAEPGTYEVAVAGSNGTCQGQLTIG